MIEEFLAASKLLNEALDQYVSACTTIHTSCVQGNWLHVNGALRELADRVADEFGLVTAYEHKLTRAKMAISGARNYCTTITPINSLPDELLTRIFCLVLSSQPCTANFKDSGNQYEYLLFPKYPDCLSHVCSRWRRVSTSSPVLWSHIDLAPCNHPHEEVANRAEMCASRAGDLPLYVHVIGLPWTKAYHAFERFLESVSTRIKSLALPIANADELTATYMLDICFQKCKPGVLTELTITDHLDFPELIWPRGRKPRSAIGLRLGSSYECLENLWHHVTVLRLYGIYPYWASKVYHGLVELRLISSGDRDILISESRLVAILSSSPQLRILHLDIDIKDQIFEDALVLPVHLGDLQVASFTFADSDEAGRLLRWLSPGSMPLQLSVTVNSRSRQFFPDDNIKGFFARSTITRLRLLDVCISSQKVTELLCRLPYLQVLALENSTCLLDSMQADAPESHPEEHNTSNVPSCLERLYMIRCRSDLGGLQWLVDNRLAQMLTLWDCTIAEGMDTLPGPTARMNTRDILNSFRVNVIAGSKPNPCRNWD